MPRLTDLTAATAVDADDPLYVVEDGNSRRTTSEAVVKAGSNASGSAPVYACRAWVNFNGTGTPAIRGSGNVSSITDNGTGDYTINFATPMPDVNYGVTVCSSSDNLTSMSNFVDGTSASLLAASVRVATTDGSSKVDRSFVSVQVFR